MFRFQQNDNIHFVHDKVVILNLFAENQFIALHYHRRYYLKCCNSCNKSYYLNKYTYAQFYSSIYVV